MGRMASGGDDIDKLLRELDAMEGSGAAATPAANRSQVAPTSSSAPASRQAGETKGKAKGGRVAFALVAAVVCGLVGAGAGMVLGPVLGWLPFLDFGFWSTGLGAALGGFLTGVVAGPPRWFSD